MTEEKLRHLQDRYPQLDPALSETTIRWLLRQGVIQPLRSSGERKRGRQLLFDEVQVDRLAFARLAQSIAPVSLDYIVTAIAKVGPEMVAKVASGDEELDIVVPVTGDRQAQTSAEVIRGGSMVDVHIGRRLTREEKDRVRVLAEAISALLGEE
jgi:hypothetical protein